MKAYGYYAEVLADEHSSIPDNLKDKLKTEAKVRVMLLFDDEETAWNDFAMSRFLKGCAEEDAVYDTL